VTASLIAQIISQFAAKSRADRTAFGGTSISAPPPADPTGAEAIGSAGADWQTNPRTQIEWGLGYIAGGYGTPCGAWQNEVNLGSY